MDARVREALGDVMPSRERQALADRLQRLAAMAVGA